MQNGTFIFDNMFKLKNIFFLHFELIFFVGLFYEYSEYLVSELDLDSGILFLSSFKRDCSYHFKENMAISLRHLRVACKGLSIKLDRCTRVLENYTWLQSFMFPDIDFKVSSSLQSHGTNYRRLIQDDTFSFSDIKHMIWPVFCLNILDEMILQNGNTLVFGKKLT